MKNKSIKKTQQGKVNNNIDVSIPVRVKQYIDKCKEKLIDLSRRNRLLFFAPSKSSTLKILFPDSNILFNKLIVNEKSLDIWLPPEEVIEKETEINDETLNINKEKVFNTTEIKKLNIKENQIVCNLKDKAEIERILKNIYRRASLDYHERGVRILYVTFGLLKWKEVETSEDINSPLILIPIELKRESVRYPFSICPIGEDSIVNPALKIKLQNDFKIELPEPPDEWEEYSFQEYFKSLEEIISNLSWSINQTVYIGTFSFYKLPMYYDLDTNIGMIISNPIVCSLGGGILKKDLVINDLPEERDLDEVLNLTEIFQILDADSSQQLCIQHALRGQSLVIQGPPGTGKSQTIGNIIAELIARGKSVCFVSEKMAALEVVFKRLKEVGLSDFCLELHSHKSNKREVIYELNRCLEKIPVPQKTLTESEFLKINTLKKYLSYYVYAIHKKHKPMNWTVYQIIGKLSKLYNFPYIPVEFDVINKLTTDEFIHIENLVNRLKTVWIVPKEKENFSWNNFCETKFTFSLKRTISTLLKDLIDKTEKLISVSNEYSITADLKHHNDLNEIEWLVETAKLLKEIPQLEPNWLMCSDTEFQRLIDKTKQFKETTEWLRQISKLFSEIPQLETNWLILSDIEFCRLIDEAKRFQKIFVSYRKVKKLFMIYKEEIFKLKLENINKRFNQIYCKWYFRWINPFYYWDKYKIVSNTINHKFSDSFKEDLRMLLELLHETEDIKFILPDKITSLITETGINSFENYLNKESNLVSQFGYRFKASDTNWDEILDALDCALRVRKLFKNKKISEKFVEICCKKADIDVLFENYLNEEISFMSQFGYCFKKSNTDWDEILNALDWASKIRKLFLDRKISEKFVELCSKKFDIQPLCNRLIESYSDLKQSINEFESNFKPRKELNHIKLEELINRYRYLLDKIDELQIWIEFKLLEIQFKETEFYRFFQELVKQAPPEKNLINIYHKSIYQTWLEKILNEDDCLGQFNRQYHEQQINDFISLDEKLIEFSPFKVIKEAISYRPLTIIDIDGSEIAILKKESVKTRRHMPLRLLFKKIPNLLFRLKPCFMMSPISVSQYLDPKIQFDLVIFDEASQISPEDSIGSIYRGKQFICVGDNKQLPPTPFFQKELMEEEIDWDNIEDDVFADLESILDECISIGLPQKMLRWHYRSKFESLIAFSNKWFYEDRLVTFPSPLENNMSKIKFVYVQDGIYDRGRTRTNKREAEVVTNLIFEHFKNSPEKTLGVVTFSLPQMVAVDVEIERRLKENIEFEKYFKDDRLEGFFVKNLENVQGDERDVMIFSLGYGKDEQGNMSMNFGPLNKPGGERRLNVAVTRAREEVIIVSSIKAIDIDPKKAKAPGVLHLWRYLNYAEKGRDSLDLKIKWGGEPESPFEEDVANEIRTLGYEIVPQVGCSCFRIDIGVIDPVRPGEFLLGVECDGSSYHSAHTVRDRDRIRQKILEKLGWKIHRIWSLDWLFNKNYEIERLKKTIDNIRERSSYNSGNKTNHVKSSDTEINIVDNIKYIDANRLDKIPGTIPYTSSKIQVQVRGDLNELEKVVSKIIETECPIHINFLIEKTARILNFWCNKYFREKVKSVIDGLIRKNKIKIEEDFIYSSNKNVLVRIPVSNAPEIFRTIEYIPPDEIYSAMLLIAKNSFGISIESLIDATARLFKLKRLNINDKQKLLGIYNRAIKDGKLICKEGKIISNEKI